ncbi:unnamed protein product [Closterium sp. NIES-53]
MICSQQRGFSGNADLTVAGVLSKEEAVAKRQLVTTECEEEEQRDRRDDDDELDAGDRRAEAGNCGNRAADVARKADVVRTVDVARVPDKTKEQIELLFGQGEMVVV